MNNLFRITLCVESTPADPAFGPGALLLDVEDVGTFAWLELRGNPDAEGVVGDCGTCAYPDRTSLLYRSMSPATTSVMPYRANCTKACVFTSSCSSRGHSGAVHCRTPPHNKAGALMRIYQDCCAAEYCTKRTMATVLSTSTLINALVLIVPLGRLPF